MHACSSIREKGVGVRQGAVVAVFKFIYVCACVYLYKCACNCGQNCRGALDCSIDGREREAESGTIPPMVRGEGTEQSCGGCTLLYSPRVLASYLTLFSPLPPFHTHIHTHTHSFAEASVSFSTLRVRECSVRVREMVVVVYSYLLHPWQNVFYT